MANSEAKSDVQKILGILEEFPNEAVIKAFRILQPSDQNAFKPSIQIPITLISSPASEEAANALDDFLFYSFLKPGDYVNWKENKKNDDNTVNVTVRGERTGCAGKKMRVVYRDSEGDEKNLDFTPQKNNFSKNIKAKEGTTAKLQKQIDGNWEDVSSYKVSS